MKPRFTLAALALASLLPAQWLDYKTPGIPRLADGRPNLSAPAPRAPDGKPDLSGIWAAECAIYGRDACFTQSMFFDLAKNLKPEDVQMTPWAARIQHQRESRDHVDDPYGYCMPPGVPRIDFGGGAFKILRTPGETAILYETLVGMLFRQVFTDGRALPASPEPSWMGYSVGRWDGDTLVVESIGFNDRTWLDTSGHPHTEALRMTERYRRRDFGHMDLEVTLQDPAVYARTWTVRVKAELAADTELLEYVCNENSRDLEHWVGKASDETKSEVKVAPEILAKYAGTYVEQPKLWRVVPRVVKISFSDGVLYGDLDGRGNERQLARSETSFSGFSGLSIEFIKDSQGEVTGLFVKHVSGDYRFARQK